MILYTKFMAKLSLFNLFFFEYFSVQVSSHGHLANSGMDNIFQDFKPELPIFKIFFRLNIL